MSHGVNVRFRMVITLWRVPQQIGDRLQCRGLVVFERVVLMGALPPVGCEIEWGEDQDSEAVRSIVYDLDNAQFVVVLNEQECEQDDEFASWQSSLLAAGWVKAG